MTDLRTAAQNALTALDQVAGAMPFPVAEMARRELRAALSAPPGWKLVPIEPTPEMLDAVRNGPEHETWRDGYHAMLAAAPSTQEPQT